MLGIGLVAYIFHEMDKRSKDVPTSKVERKENQREVGKSDASSFKKSENKIELKKEKGNPSLFQLNSSGNALIH
jgi:hypothetical protein